MYAPRTPIVDPVAVGSLVLKGDLDCSGNPNYPAATLGDWYLVTVGGRVGGAAGKVVNVGDSIVAKAANAGGTEAAVGTHWFVVEANLTPDDSTLERVGDTLRVKDGGVTLPKLASIATDVVLGRSSPGVGVVQTIPCTAAGRALIGAADASAQRTILGLSAAIVGTVGATNNAIPRADGTGGSTLKASSARITDSGALQAPQNASGPVYTSVEDLTQGLWLRTTGRTQLSGGGGGGNTLELETGGGSGPVCRVNGNSASSNVYLFSGVTTNNVYSATRYEVSSRLVDLFVGAAAEGVGDANRRNSAFIGTTSGYPLRVFTNGVRRAQFGNDSGAAPSLQLFGAAAGDVVLRLTTDTTGDDPTEDYSHYRTTTTDGATTTIATIALAASQTVTIEAHVVARRTGGTGGTAEDGAAYGVVATVKNVGGVATLIGTPTVLYTHEDQAAWDATIAVAGGNALVQVTGAANNNVTWHAHVRRRYVGS